jgi:hypothetical protein
VLVKIQHYVELTFAKERCLLPSLTHFRTVKFVTSHPLVIIFQSNSRAGPGALILVGGQGLGVLDMVQIGGVTNTNAGLFSDSLWRLETILDVGERLLARRGVCVRLCIWYTLFYCCSSLIDWRRVFINAR